MDAKEDKILAALQDLHNRIGHLEKVIEDTKAIELTIERVQTLNLENLIYQLDKIDIKELSGSLNIGNTFEQKQKSQQGSKENNQALKRNHQENEEILIKINNKHIPYTIDEVKQSEKISSTLPSSSEFTIGDIHIGTIEDASAVNFGNNFPTNFRSNKKHNQGLGNIIGDNNDIHDLKSFMKEKNAREVYNENQENQEPAWLHVLEKDEEGEGQGN
ncbi:MAG: hypothetical protein ACQEUT_12070 [Bacillota bacterium]